MASNTIVLPQGTYPVGSRTLGPSPIAQGISKLSLQLDATAMTDPALIIDMTLDFSPDGGVHWASVAPGFSTDPFPITVKMIGGMRDKNGNPLTIYHVTVSNIPSQELTTRQMRAFVTISGVPLTTQGSLVLT